MHHSNPHLSDTGLKGEELLLLLDVFSLSQIMEYKGVAYTVITAVGQCGAGDLNRYLLSATIMKPGFTPRIMLLQNLFSKKLSNAEALKQLTGIA